MPLSSLSRCPPVSIADTCAASATCLTASSRQSHAVSLPPPGYEFEQTPDAETDSPSWTQRCARPGFSLCMAVVQATIGTAFVSVGCTSMFVAPIAPGSCEPEGCSIPDTWQARGPLLLYGAGVMSCIGVGIWFTFHSLRSACRAANDLRVSPRTARMPPPYVPRDIESGGFTGSANLPHRSDRIDLGSAYANTEARD